MPKGPGSKQGSGTLSRQGSEGLRNSVSAVAGLLSRVSHPARGRSLCVYVCACHFRHALHCVCYKTGPASASSILQRLRQ